MRWHTIKDAVKEAAIKQFSVEVSETHGMNLGRLGHPVVRGFGSAESIEQQLAGGEDVCGEVTWPGSHRVGFVVHPSPTDFDIEWGDFCYGIDEDRSGAADSEGMAQHRRRDGGGA